MFISKNKYKDLINEIADLKRRILIMQSEECRLNQHDWVIVNEHDCDYNFCGNIETYESRILECRKCGKQIKDSNYRGDWKYKIKDN